MLALSLIMVGSSFITYTSGDRRFDLNAKGHPPHRGSGATRDGAGVKSEAAASDHYAIKLFEIEPPGRKQTPIPQWFCVRMRTTMGSGGCLDLQAFRLWISFN
jgi:hypothetical protein